MSNRSSPNKDVCHRITDWLEGTSGALLVQPPCSSRDTYSSLPRIMSRWLLNVSKNGDCTTSPGNLCQCSATLTVRKCFLMLRSIFLCISLRTLPLVLSLGTTHKQLASVLFAPSLQEFVHTDEIPLDCSLLQPEESQLIQPSLRAEMLQSLHHLRDLLLDPLQ